jgi:hypothetical protein
MAFGQEADTIVRRQLASLLSSIESDFKADALTYVGPISYGADDRIKDAIEALTRSETPFNLHSGNARRICGGDAQNL